MPPRYPRKRGAEYWTEPDGSGEAGHEAALGHGPTGHPSRGADHSSERQRNHRFGAAHRLDSTGAWEAGAAPQKAREAPRRQRLSLAQEPARASSAPDQEPHRTPGDRFLRAARPAPLGGGAHDRLDEPDAPADLPLRTARRHLRWVASARLRPHLLQFPEAHILTWPLFGAESHGTACQR
jgi:hypothetical protein